MSQGGLPGLWGRHASALAGRGAGDFGPQLMALIAYPFVWLLLLPFRIVGVAVHGVLEVIFLAITLPFRLLTAPFRI